MPTETNRHTTTETNLTVDRSDEDGHVEAESRRGWWYDNLRYPALGVAVVGLVTAFFAEPVKKWLDSAMNQGPIEPAAAGNSRLVEFLKKNEECTKAPGDLFQAPGDVEILATICSKTGDIYLAFYYAEGGEKKIKYGGIFLRDTLQNGSKGIVVADLAAPSNAMSSLVDIDRFFSFSADAHTNYVDANFNTYPKNDSAIQLAQVAPIVVCQAFPPDGTIVRMIQWNGQCFAETINSQSGFVISSSPISCSNPCP